MQSKTILPEEAWKLIVEEGYNYIDVRTEEEFEQGHPDGAYNVPIAILTPSGTMASNADFVPIVSAHFAKDAKLIVGCKMGGRSKKAFDELTSAGFKNVLDQTAGFSGKKNPFGGVQDAGWQQADLPVSMQAKEGRSFAELKEQ